MARSRKSKTSVKVNFKGVESRQTPPEGDYIVEVLEAKSGKSGNGNEQIEFALEIAKGKYKGTKLWLYCPLQENSLWKLHAFLTALGQEVPEDEMDIDLSELVGEQCVGVLTHEVYNGRKRAKMTDFDSLENYSGDADSDDDEDDDDDTPKKGKKSKSKKSSKKKSRDEDEDEDDEDEDEDERPAKKGKGKKSKSDDDEDDDDDEDEKPSKKSKSKGKKKPKKLSRDDVEDMDEDELQELIDEHDLDVDLDDYKKLPKKVSAVIDALEEEDLLEDEDDD
jgi:hypothetical protein